MTNLIAIQRYLDYANARDTRTHAQVPPRVDLQFTPPSLVPYYALLAAVIVIARIVTRKILVRKDGPLVKRLQEKEWSEGDDLSISASLSECSTDFEDNDDEPDTSMSALLHTAALNISDDDHDYTIYAARLREDWLEQEPRSVECMSRFMPLRLAEEVHALVEAANSGDQE